MRILDDKSDKGLNNVTLYLTEEEAVQLESDLNQLLSNPALHHCHLSSDDYQKEITVCIYKENNLSSFDERSRKLILCDE